MEHLLFIEEKLIESIYENIELISCKEMGEMIDMIKDIEKALCADVKIMIPVLILVGICLGARSIKKEA